MKWVLFLLMALALWYMIYSSRAAVQRQLSSSTLEAQDGISAEVEVIEEEYMNWVDATNEVIENS